MDKISITSQPSISRIPLNAYFKFFKILSQQYSFENGANKVGGKVSLVSVSPVNSPLYVRTLRDCSQNWHISFL